MLMVALVGQASQGIAAGRTLYLVDKDQYRSLREKSDVELTKKCYIFMKHFDLLVFLLNYLAV